MKVLFILLLILPTSGECALPTTKMCVEENRIAWRGITPYVESTRGGAFNYTGVLYDVFYKSLRACCRGNLNFSANTSFRTQADVAGLAYKHKVDFIIPVQRSKKSTTFQNYPYIPLVESPGLAFYVRPDPSSGTIMIQAIKSVAPLVMLMFVMVSISGTIFWICESMSLAWLGRQPQSFLGGVLSGFWWAFVSMTTVGYGDIIPKTKPTKVFSLIWVLIGVAFCALFTSSITTMLTLSLITREVTLPGMRVGVLKGSEEFRYALKKQAIPKDFDSVDELLEAAENKKISAILLDAYIAAEVKHSIHGLHLHKIIEHISTNGVVFQNNGFRFASCIRDFLFSRQMEVFSLISKRVKTLSTHEHEEEFSSTTLIDSRDPTIHIPIYAMMGTLAVVLMVGSFKDWITKRLSDSKLRKKNEELEKEKALLEIRELTLSQWRAEYKIDLGRALLDIQEDSERIRLKVACIVDKIEEIESAIGSPNDLK